MTPNEEILLKELKAARVTIRKMKDECNEYEEGFAIGKAALKRINCTLNEFRQPVALMPPKSEKKENSNE